MFVGYHTHVRRLQTAPRQGKAGHVITHCGLGLIDPAAPHSSPLQGHPPKIGCGPRANLAKLDRPFAFALRTDLEGGRAFIFCAMSDEDLEGWLGAIHAACALTHGAGITDALQSK